MADIGTCPYCNQDFTVTTYGYKIQCPLCGGLVDIMPDPDLLLDTPFGMVGISYLRKSGGNK